jgi:hypothetical protein
VHLSLIAGSSAFYYRYVFLEAFSLVEKELPQSIFFAKAFVNE